MGVKERLSFEDATAPTLIALEHQHRYRLASGLVEGRRVLDLCCGSGYGSRQLARRALSVHGVDNDAASVDAAAARIGGADARIGGADAISFEAADALEFIRRDDTPARFDVIVCFEGLEHLEPLEPMLERLRELAEAGVRMVLSVPNSIGQGEDNEFHVTDFSWEDARERIGSFPQAVMLTQHLAEGSMICAAEPTAEDLDGRIELGDRHEPEYANHFLFLVGFPPPAADGLMQLEAAPVHNRYLRNVEAANQALRRTNQRFMRGHLGRSDSAAGAFVAKYEAVTRDLAELEAAHAELEAAHAALETEHRAWLERCAEAERQVVEARTELHHYTDSQAVRAFANVWRRRRGGR